MRAFVWMAGRKRTGGLSFGLCSLVSWSDPSWCCLPVPSEQVPLRLAAWSGCCKIGSILEMFKRNVSLRQRATAKDLCHRLRLSPERFCDDR